MAFDGDDELGEAAVHSACSPKTSLIARRSDLGAVADEQDRLLGIKAAVDEVREQRPGQGGVWSSLPTARAGSCRPRC